MVISTQLVFSTYLLNWNLKVSNETLPKIFKIRGRCVCMCVCVTKKKKCIQGGPKEPMETN